MLDVLLYGALPYVAFSIFLLISIQRYVKTPFTYSSLSSQFLESRRLFWGSVPFHLGVLFLFFGHLVGFLIPRQIMFWNEAPLRLFVLEAAALAAALLFGFGMVGLIVRRAASARLRSQTSVWDVIVYALLLFQVVTGIWVALGLRWGISWYTAAVVPYLWSIVRLQPEVPLMAELPLAARLHVLGAFTLTVCFSFTRLVHTLVAPVPYLWRPLQQVIWNRRRGLTEKGIRRS